MNNNQVNRSSNGIPNILPLKPEEEDLIRFIRGLQWGHLTIEVKELVRGNGGVPVMIKQPQRDIKLSRDDRPNRTQRRGEP